MIVGCKCIVAIVPCTLYKVGGRRRGSVAIARNTTPGNHILSDSGFRIEYVENDCGIQINRSHYTYNVIMPGAYLSTHTHLLSCFLCYSTNAEAPRIHGNHYAHTYRHTMRGSLYMLHICFPVSYYIPLWVGLR